jgi:hypothetical protein
MNTSVSSTTGISPHYAIFAQHPLTMADIFTDNLVTNATVTANTTDIPQAVLDGLTTTRDLPVQTAETDIDTQDTAIPTDAKQFEAQLAREMQVLHDNVLTNKQHAQQVYKDYYDKHFKAREQVFPVGTLVLMSNPPRNCKISKKFSGPYMVVKVVQIDPKAPRVYLLQSTNTGAILRNLINGDRLRPVSLRQTKDISIPDKGAQQVTANNANDVQASTDRRNDMSDRQVASNPGDKSDLERTTTSQNLPHNKF